MAINFGLEIVLGKICILVPGHWDHARGGAEYQAHVLANHIKATTNHDVIYLARDITEDSLKHKYSVSKISAVFRNFRYGLFWDAISLYFKLKKINPDVIWQRTGSAYTGIAAFYCKMQHKPFIWHVANADNVEKKEFPTSLGQIPKSIDNLLLAYGIKNASCIVTQTKSQSDILMHNYARHADYVIRNFHSVPSGEFIKSDRLTITWVANFKKRKQPEIFIKLAAEFSHNKNITFKMIGKREKSQWGDKIVAEIEKCENIEFLGQIDQEQVSEQLASAHVLVNTSLYEGFPNTFIQAWLREVLTLSLNVDPDDVINKYRLGCHAVKFEKMTEYISHLCENRNELEGLGKAARVFAKENYSMKNADRLISILSLDGS